MAGVIIHLHFLFNYKQNIKFMSEIVFYNNQDYSKATAITNSLLVAETFEMEHSKVIRNIKSILETLNEATSGGVENLGQTTSGSTDFYIKETSYTDKKGEKRPLYEMDKKFFTLLIMNFKSKKALQFKIDYINQFELMEKELIHRNETRLIGKQVRRRFTDSIQLINDLSKDPDWKKWSFKLYSDLIYKKAFNGKTAKQLKIEKGVRGKNLRDYLALEELQEANKWEDIVDLYIWKNKLYLLPINEAYQEVKKFLKLA